MSIVPFLFSDWWQDLNEPHHLFDQNFGLTLRPEQLLLPSNIHPHYSWPHSRKRAPLYYRPWNNLMRQTDGGGTSTVKDNEGQFQVILDVQQFKPDEISVKVVDKCIVIEGKHEEQKDDHGTISRHFVRKYIVPEQCDIEQVSSTLSIDGVLNINVPRKEKTLPKYEKIINIEQTKKPANNEGKQEIEQKTNKSNNEKRELKK